MKRFISVIFIFLFFNSINSDEKSTKLLDSEEIIQKKLSFEDKKLLLEIFFTDAKATFRVIKSIRPYFTSWHKARKFRMDHQNNLSPEGKEILGKTHNGDTKKLFEEQPKKYIDNLIEWYKKIYDSLSDKEKGSLITTRKLPFLNSDAFEKEFKIK